MQKVIHFQSRLIFSSQLIAGWFWFCSFVYMFIRTLSQSSVIIKLLIALHLHVCIASYWVSHQIMWYKKIIYDHGLKITRSWCFFGFVGSYVWGWYHLHNFNPTKVGGSGVGPIDPPANLFVITWKTLLYRPWCSRTFNQIYMGSH